jgi:pimeloyl-ACP methyl ester carboxylesterase
LIDLDTLHIQPTAEIEAMDPQITQNTFCSYTGSPSSATIFFITGNPGLIGYYHPFLSSLAQNLSGSTDQSKPTYQIYGCSLGGFEVDENISSETPRFQGGESQKGSKLYDLEDQIRFVHQRLDAVMSDGSTSSRKRNVVLIGHSVGAYMAMEVIRRHRESDVSDFDIVGGVLLFPTVMDIAASPSGQKLTVGLAPFVVRLGC